MLRDFETRLADVLGARLPAPLSGAVDVSPGRAESRIILGVTNVQRLEDDLLSLRPERVPGDNLPRRVLKLHCSVELDVRLPANASRAEQMLAIDQALYLLDDSSMRDGSALLPGDGSDPGFLIRSMMVSGGIPPQSITLDAQGFFWPTGTAGSQGPQILHARLRSALKPLTLDPQPSQLLAGGPPVDFRIDFAKTGTMVIGKDDMSTDGYGALLVAIIDAGGRPGSGNLSGGENGPAGSRKYAVSDGGITVTYTPPAAPVTEFMVVNLEGDAGGPGVELGRFSLRTRSS